MSAFSSKDRVFLFDMDGTITPARKLIENDMILFLRELTEHAYVGIVSGSPYSYIFEQLTPVFKEKKEMLEKILIMPCNGTQMYAYDHGKTTYKQTYEVTLKDHLSASGAAPTAYRELITHLLTLQSYAVLKYKDLPLSGNFISFRKSLLNWSMIGRDASHEQRNTFVKLDKKYNLRNDLSDLLRIHLDDSGLHSIETALGGSTSIDIYPKGWDKTHALKHIDPAWSVFFGDKCKPGGNDYTLYSHLNSLGRGFEVKSPQDTIALGRQLLEKIKGNKNG